jgi:hypothetical protein
MSHPYHAMPAEEDRCPECKRERKEIKTQEAAEMTAPESAKPMTPRIDVARLAEIIDADVRRGEYHSESGRLALDIIDLMGRVSELEREIAAAPQVECACHPGVRWPVETWGRTCPISKVERQAAASQAECAELREVLEHVEDYFDQRADADAQGDPSRFVGNAEMSYLGDIRRALSRFPGSQDALRAAERAAEERGVRIGANAARDLMQSLIRSPYVGAPDFIDRCVDSVTPQQAKP